MSTRVAGDIYNWTRYWVEQGGNISLNDGGFLVDPESSAGGLYNPKLVRFEAISHYPVLILLGEPGIGKTTAAEAAYEACRIQLRGTPDALAKYDLREYGSDTELLNTIFRSDKWRTWESGTHFLHIFLDSLDECRLRVDNVAQIIAGQLRDCPIERLFLRISCRTAEWPSLFEDALRSLWEDNDKTAQGWGHVERAVRLYELAPLRRKDVVDAALASRVDPDAFLTALALRDVVPLAIKPITLRFLLRSYRRKHEFPGNRTALYKEGCRLLSEETNESRVASERIGTFAPEQRMILAARIAAVTIFSNRYAVWMGTGADDNPNEDDDVAVRQLYGGKESAEGEQFSTNRAAVRETLGTGLFSSRGRSRMGWAHQTYAEFLAACYLVEHRLSTEQIMSLLVHPGDSEGKLVPQVHETAAWLANMRSEVFNAIMDVDPAVLLRSDVANVSPTDRARLVESLLSAYAQGKLLDRDHAIRTLYPRLSYPGLAAQLRRYIVDKGVSERVRNVAVDIAEDCQQASLGTILATLALDPTEPMQLRINAAAALNRIGDEETKALLKPLLTNAEHKDIDDELKGAALHALWPKQLSAQELFDALTPPKQRDLLSLYTSFFYEAGMEHLGSSDVPIALEWVEGLPAGSGRDPMYRRIMDAVLFRAWEVIEAEGVVEPLGKLLLTRDRYSAYATTEVAIAEAVFRDDDKRHLLLQRLVAEFVSTGDSPGLIAWARLAFSKDVPWLMEQIEAREANRHDHTQVEQEQRVLAELSQAVLAWDDRPSLEAIFYSAERSAVVAEQFRWFLQGIDRRSEVAQQQRQMYVLEQEAKQDEGTFPTLDPPLPVRLARLLDRFEEGETEAWWYLNLQMAVKPAGSGLFMRDEWQSDLTKLFGWEVADAETRDRIIRTASEYLLRQDPGTQAWLGKDILHRPAYAGYRALRLLLRRAPDTLEVLPHEVWRQWAPITVAYQHFNAADEDHGDQGTLVALAYKHAPQEVLHSLLVLIDQDSEKNRSLSALDHLESCWDKLIVDKLVAKLSDDKLRPISMGALLRQLLQRNIPQAKEYAVALLSLPLGRRGRRRERALVAAEMLAACADYATWTEIWHVMESDARFGRELVERLVHIDRNLSETPLSQRLTEDQLADLYSWLLRQYPPSDEEHPEGVHSVTTREEIARWRDAIPSDLARRGTGASVKALQRLMQELPHVSYLEYTLHSAKAMMRERTWIPVPPDVLLRLVQTQQARLVSNADQLLSVIVESLRGLEKELQGNTAAAEEVWTYSKLGNKKLWRPKDENEFSNRVKRHLERDIKQRGLIVNINREPEIRPGQELDLYIEAAVGFGAEVEDVVSMVIETKGCWHEDLYSAMETQLVNTYLTSSNSTRGLYLVGWFNCPKWEPGDSRRDKAEALAPDREELQARLSQQARALTGKGLHIEALVVNAALP